MASQYCSEIIKETISGKPFLLPDETIRFAAEKSLSASELIVCVVLLFIPPFVVWGLAALALLYFSNHKHSGVWVTRLRVIDYDKAIFRNQYEIISVPLGQIAEIQMASLQRGNVFWGMVDRIFGVGDLEIQVHDASRRRLSLLNVKKPKRLLSAIKHELMETRA